MPQESSAAENSLRRERAIRVRITTHWVQRQVGAGGQG
jgi:hypothetical protein